LGVNHEDGGSKVIRNVGILPRHYTASQPRRPQRESSSPSKFQILHLNHSYILMVYYSDHNNTEILLMRGHHLVLVV